ncbi:MAG TPA: GuaB3 family IMP dehydrogenase-related protein [Candidatus Dormibacteraeota bacterium]|nr:GuaB3 family IMP dehydrogenase-related protein [Candidatus Dormibacteraeota bacterium]
MDIEVGRGKRARRAYGFDEIALVPGKVTINPEEIDIHLRFGDLEVPVPIMAAAMDGVVDPAFAIEMGKVGGLAVLNLDGLQCRYDDPSTIFTEIVEAPRERVNALLQERYRAPVREDLIGSRIEAIRRGGGPCVVSSIPAEAERRLGPVVEAGANLFVVQGTVLTARHISSSYRQLDFADLVRQSPIPVVVGNCVEYYTALELMASGIAGILVGVGPGAACTTRGVLGVGVPQVTATADVAAARNDHRRTGGQPVTVITDGGMRLGGDITKALAAGADGVMVGSPFAGVVEAAGRGHYWGMATPDPNLPRGTRITVGTRATLRELLFGPARVDDGTQNLVGALKSAMGVCGARTIEEFQQTELVVAPSILTEGKLLQQAQQVGMAR